MNVGVAAFVAALVTALAALGASEITSRRTLAAVEAQNRHAETMQRAQFEENARVAALERRTLFQQQMLLDLQEALFQPTRASVACQHQDLLAFRQTGVWGENLVGDELSEQERQAMARTSILAARVQDDVVRELVDRMKDACSRMAIATSQQQSEQARTDLAPAFTSANERIGELLRSLY